MGKFACAMVAVVLGACADSPMAPTPYNEPLVPIMTGGTGRLATRAWTHPIETPDVVYTPYHATFGNDIARRRSCDHASGAYDAATDVCTITTVGRDVPVPPHGPWKAV